MGALGAVAPSHDVASWGLQILAVWLIGLVLGWLLPKPKWVDRSLKAKALLLSTPPGLWARRVAVAAHLSLIVREVWRNLFAPGTFRGVLRAAWRTLTTGAPFAWPRPNAAADGAASLALAAPGAAADAWHITAKDLAWFKWTIDEDGAPSGASPWEPMMHRTWPGCTYTAWRRTLPGGKSEYKSVTISEDATPEEYMDFYLDDATRMQWDSMISETQLLESGDAEGRCQVVRWLRTFPFAFISQREYIIARRFFREDDGSLCAVTRGLAEHPAAPRIAGQVRMQGFHSAWRSRTVPCPRGSGRPAVETTLLHFEDFGIPERLARFAVRHGMAGFVKSMIPAVAGFVAERRTRCDPHAEDPASYGRRQLAAAAVPAPATPALSRCGSLASVAGTAESSLGAPSQADAGEDSGSERGGLARSGSMRRLGAMMLASGVAIALARTASTGNLAAAQGSGRPAGHGARGGGAAPGAARHHPRRHSAGHAHGPSYRGALGSGDAPPRHRRRQHAAPTAVQA